SKAKITGCAEFKPTGRSEMRKQLLSVFVPLLVMVFIAAAAETQKTGTDAVAPATLQKVNVARGSDGLSLEVTTRGMVNPQVSTLDHPARILLDLPNTVMASSRNQVAVGSDGVKGVRIGMDGHKNTRLVIDLEHAYKYELLPAEDGKIVLKLQTAQVAKINAPSAAKVTSAPVQPPKQELAMNVTPVAPKVAKESSPTDFVFLEPAYKPKETEAKSDSAEPSERAANAAQKFAERPEGNLLPAPSAMQSGVVVQSQPAVNLSAEQKAQLSQQPANGAKYTGEPISVNLKDV